eukprot:2117371-Pyramimonas_sp.AAC.1
MSVEDITATHTAVSKMKGIAMKTLKSSEVRVLECKVGDPVELMSVGSLIVDKILTSMANSVSEGLFDLAHWFEQLHQVAYQDGGSRDE